MELLLSKGYTKKTKPYSLIHLAIRSDNFDCLHYVLKEMDLDQEINRKSKGNKYPLQVALKSGSIKCLELLLNKGAYLIDEELGFRRNLVLGKDNKYFSGSQEIKNPEEFKITEICSIKKPHQGHGGMSSNPSYESRLEEEKNARIELIRRARFKVFLATEALCKRQDVSNGKGNNKAVKAFGLMVKSPSMRERLLRFF